jgi:hypothetical protein
MFRAAEKRALSEVLKVLIFNAKSVSIRVNIN